LLLSSVQEAEKCKYKNFLTPSFSKVFSDTNVLELISYPRYVHWPGRERLRQQGVQHGISHFPAIQSGSELELNPECDS